MTTHDENEQIDLSGQVTLGTGAKVLFGFA